MTGGGAEESRAEVARLQAEFAAALRSVRAGIAARGLETHDFFLSSALFDGPGPEAVTPGTVTDDARVYGSASDMLRSLRLTAGPEVCQIGAGNVGFARRILDQLSPRVFRLFDQGFDRLDQSIRSAAVVVLHAGDPATVLADLPDGSINYAYVDGDHSYEGSRRILSALLPKIAPGGFIQMKDYAPWSVLSGLPYGIMASVNELLNRGGARLVGVALNPLGYHDVLMRTAAAVVGAVEPFDIQPSPNASPQPVADAEVARGTADLASDHLVPRDPTRWTAVCDFLGRLERDGRHRPAVLDWTRARAVAAALPGLPVFSPPDAEASQLPYVDSSVDVVVVPLGDATRMSEARRVATAAVVEVGDDDSESTAGTVVLHPSVEGAGPGDAGARVDDAAFVHAAGGRELEGRAVLICSYYMPQPDCDSYSRRLWHFVRFLRQAGCEVTCVAQNQRGVDAFEGLLTDLGVRVFVGLDPQRVAMLARQRSYDWAILGFWNIAAPLVTALRAAAPAMRIVVDSGDVHFLRQARHVLQAADGNTGLLDTSFANDTAAEIDVYAAADAVLAVSRKEADLVADLIGDCGRAFAVPDAEDLVASTLPFASRSGMFFVGNFEHPPNAEALGYLCESILPHVDPVLLAEHPIYVAGSHMTERVRALAAGWPTVRTLGWVPSVEPYLERVRVSLLPLLHGAGTKRKLIQALSIGTPTVTTSVGVEGFPLADEREVLVADDPILFAAGITRLLTDEHLWTRLATAGRETIRVGHGLEVARERLLASLEAIRTAPRRAAPRRAETAAAAAQRADGPGDDREEAPCPFRGLGAVHVVTRPAVRDRGAPEISVVIPTRDRAVMLREALASLVAQTVEAERFEVVVVSDGSTDATSEVCRDAADRLRLSLVESPPSGISVAKNLGIDLAAAPLVLFFDDDDVADPGLVAAHLAAHRRYPPEHVAVLGFTDWHERLDRTEVMRFVTDVGHYLFSYTSLRDGQVLDHTYFWGGRSSCKKSLLLRAGGFRPELTFGSEDIEAGYRMSRLVTRERAAAGLGPAHAAAWPGVTVVYRPDAVQHMIRPITYDEFCRRCERQGRSQWQFSRFYADARVDRWCGIGGAAARWEGVQAELAAKVARVHAIERLVSTASGRERGPLVEELHALYWWTFDAFKTKGIVEAARG